ncbi:MAG: hypothetical protein ACRYFU_25645 [Janthinobacterium lividum]
MASSTKELLSKLKTSLPKIEATAEPLRPVHQFPEPSREKAGKGGRAPKLSVSLYQHDIERLDDIKDFMKSQGFRNLSDSEALRLACRQVQIDGALVDVYRSMQSEDGRRTRLE